MSTCAAISLLQAAGVGSIVPHDSQRGVSTVWLAADVDACRLMEEAMNAVVWRTVVRENPEPGESFKGNRLRLVEANRYSRLAHLLPSRGTPAAGGVLAKLTLASRQRLALLVDCADGDSDRLGSVHVG